MNNFLLKVTQSNMEFMREGSEPRSGITLSQVKEQKKLKIEQS